MVRGRNDYQVVGDESLNRVAVRRVQLVDPGPQDSRCIEEVLAMSANATIFHTSEWNGLLVDEFGLKCTALLATVGERPVGLYGFCPRDGQRCQSSVVERQSVYGGPIATSESREVVAALLTHAERIGWLSQFQIWSPPSYDIAAFVAAGYGYRLLYTSIVNLQASEEELWGRLHKDKRTKIRKAMRNGLAAVEGGIADLDDYRAMVENTLAPSGLESLPRSFYVRLLERLAPLGRARLMLVKRDDVIVSGAIILYYKDTAYAWDIGWRREYGGLSPNDLLTWEIIRSARYAGYASFDLLRIEPERLPGIASWKLAFGGETVPCYLFEKATPGYRAWRALTFPASPRRIAGRLHRVTSGGDNGH